MLEEWAEAFLKKVDDCKWNSMLLSPCHLIHSFPKWPHIKLKITNFMAWNFSSLKVFYDKVFKSFSSGVWDPLSRSHPLCTSRPRFYADFNLSLMQYLTQNLFLPVVDVLALGAVVQQFLLQCLSRCWYPDPCCSAFWLAIKRDLNYNLEFLINVVSN